MVLSDYLTVGGKSINGNDIAYICALCYGDRSDAGNYMFDTCYLLSALGDQSSGEAEKDWGLTKEDVEELKKQWGSVGIAPEKLDYFKGERSGR